MLLHYAVLRGLIAHPLQDLAVAQPLVELYEVCMVVIKV
jgi:hypothetical protein